MHDHFDENLSLSPVTGIQRILTGIKPSGTPHIGNYVGAIRPALAASRAPGAHNFFFLADLHSLINTSDPLRVQRSTLSIAATWLACGLDTNTAWFYRQSDIPEIAELNWLLSCVTGKGMLNRAHAYKAAVDKNAAAGDDGDTGISAGLYTYPVLMAADILIFGADRVPVGRDQVQHIEMARDIAQRFEHVYGAGHFTLPHAVVDDNVATLPGLDGRKMSKSYDNTIPLFATSSELKKLVYAIRTDSRVPGDPKQIGGNALFELYRAFADTDQVAGFAEAYAQGIGWADAKQRLFERIDQELAPLRDRYHDLVARPQDIEALLRMNAEKLRDEYARPMLARLRDAVGLRSLSAIQAAAPSPTRKTARAAFKQYREVDGRFYFKLLDDDGSVQFQSTGYASGREAASAIEVLRSACSERELSMLGTGLPVSPSQLLEVLERMRSLSARG